MDICKVIYVRKLDNTVQQYDLTKIKKTVENAGFVKHTDPTSLCILLEEINTEVEKMSKRGTTINATDLYLCVVEKMRQYSEPASECYVLHKVYQTDKKRITAAHTKVNIDESIQTPFSSIGRFIHKRTYARHIDNDINKPIEEFVDTIKRVVKSCRDDLHVGFSAEEEFKFSSHLMNLKGSVAGRFLWQLGSETVNELGFASLQNCAAVVVDHHVKPIVWAMSMLMLGDGVGFNICRKYTSKIKNVLDNEIKIVHDFDNAEKNSDFYVRDSREGWVELIKNVLEAYFDTGIGFSYSTKLVRKKGSLIKKFGGIASGPDDLILCVRDISEILEKNRGKKLEPCTWVDIADAIAKMVKSGNVRRSALIMLGDASDEEYLKLKRWDQGVVIPSYRSCANHSVVCNDINDLSEIYWESYEKDGNGNPRGEQYGLVNLNLCQKMGRICDGTKYPDPDVVIVNPCGEQPLNNFETCCLADINLPNINSQEELNELAIMLYRVMKHSLAMKCHEKETETIVHKNMRMGLSVSGYMQVDDEKKSWLPILYSHLRKYDNYYSDAHGWNRSIKLTTVKPSGTLSLLPGITPGCHPALFRYYIRTVRVAKNSPYIKILKSHGYPMEVDITNANAMVVSFPCESGPDAVLAENVTAIDQLNVVKKLQMEWSDNAVSCTVYYKDHELNDIKAWLKENYNKYIKTVSFMPYIDHGWPQAPYQPITYEEYVKLSSKCSVIHNFEMELHKHDDDDDDDDDMLQQHENCKNGGCNIR